MAGVTPKRIQEIKDELGVKAPVACMQDIDDLIQKLGLDVLMEPVMRSKVRSWLSAAWADGAKWGANYAMDTMMELLKEDT